MDHALASVLEGFESERALVVYPEPLADSAAAIAAALERRGFATEVRLTPEASFQDPDRVLAASGWVPPPTSETCKT